MLEPALPDFRDHIERQDLVPGAVLVEASAGTGKTHNIANLVLRLVAEVGLAVDQVLVVTFTKAATAELRDRVHARLGVAAEALAGLAEGRPLPAGDEVLRRVASGSPDEVELRLRRLRAARRDFDAAPISTIHGFCQRVLQTHTFESGAEWGAELVEDTSELLAEIVDDYLTRTLRDVDARECAFLVDSCGLRRDSLLGIAAAVTGDPDARIEPGATDLAAWRTERDTFRARWEAGRAALGKAIDDAVAGKLARKRQSTYKPAATAAFLEEVSAWLADPSSFPFAVTDDHKAFRYFRPATVEHYFEGRLDPPLSREVEDFLVRTAEALDGPRAAFAAFARERLRERLARRGQVSFDELLRRVRDRLVADGGETLARALRERYRAALVDEFQDTDGVQWEVFARVFRDDPDAFLYLIGDPKQAIYGFRGADVEAYGRAAAGIPRRFTMIDNWRSDERYVAALNGFLGRSRGLFGTSAFDYVKVRAGLRTPPARLRFPDGRPPLRLRWFAGDGGAEMGKGEAWEALPGIVGDEVVALIGAGAERLVPGGDGGPPRWTPLRLGDIAVLVRKNDQARAVQDALRARGIASVLSLTGSVWHSEEAAAVSCWLDAVASPDQEGPTRKLALTLLGGWTGRELALGLDEAERRGTGGPGPPGAGDDGGGPPEGEATAPARSWDRLRARVHEWAEDFDDRGFVAAFRRVLADPDLDVLPRLARFPDGERRLTDLRHVVELLGAESARDRLGAAGLARVLSDRRTAGTPDGDAAELRLETDADAVQIVTLHKCKGLQYPVVVLPYLWDGARLIRWDLPRLRFQDQGVRKIDLRQATSLPPKDRHVEIADAEAGRENMRLLYVGLTRALHHAVAFYGPVNEVAQSPLAAALHGLGAGPPEHRLEAAEEEVGAALAEGPTGLRAAIEWVDGIRAEDGSALARVDEGAEAAGAAGPGTGVGGPTGSGRGAAGVAGTAAVAGAGVAAGPAPVAGADACAGVLEAAEFPARDFQPRWRLWSFTALLRDLDAAPGRPTAAEGSPAAADALGVDHDAVAAPGEGPGAQDPGPAPPAPDLSIPGLAREIPWSQLRSGREIGTYVHKLMELLDFGTVAERGGRGRDLPALARDLGHRMGLDDPAQVSLVVDHVPRVLATPLPLSPGGPPVRLAGLGIADRLDELRFDLPLAGGDLRGPGGPGVVAGRALAEALSPWADGDGSPGRPPASWLARVREAGIADLAGFLTGSIDLVLRVRDGGAGRWFVCDYKTNRIASPAVAGPRPSTFGHYTAPWMRWEMERHDYFLQYALYLVALHRHLRARLGDDYDYDTHVGGAVYLFLRGMEGEAARPGPDGVVPGVYVDRPPRRVIEGLSDLFAGKPGGAQ